MRLYITEKPSQVVALKKVIKDKVLYAPLAGHILRQYNPNEYNDELTLSNWNKNVMNENYPFFPKEWKKKIKENSTYMMNGKKMTSDYKKRFMETKDMIDKASEIVIASDPDNEGVVLAMEVIEACKATHKIIGMVNMAKLDSSSLSKELKILNKIPYNKMNDAGNLRANFDWLFGMNLSPIATIYLGSGQTMHMGGVKLPTIRMVVERDLAFEAFEEIPFWELKGTARDPKTGIEFPINIKYDGNDRFDSENLAKNAMNELNKTIKVSEYKESDKKSAPPKPYSLTDLQVESGRMYKLNAKQVADIAQRLYTNGDQSYPRTEENYYADGQYAEVDGTISHLRELKEFSHINLKTPYLKRDIFNDKKLEGKAHTALSPTMQKADLSKMSDLDQKIYLLVATRYYIQFMEDYKYLNISIKSIDGKFDISASENVEQSKGWKELSKYSNSQEESETKAERTFPILNKGDDLEIIHLELKKGLTKPKPRFTEASLLKAMERISTIYDDPQVKEHLGESGIGTPATRASILDELKQNKRKSGNKTIDIEPYLKLDKGKVISTQKARDMIRLLPDDITSPVLRAELEAMTKSVVYKNINSNDILKTIEDKILLFSNEIKQIAKDNNIKPTSGFGGAISEKQINFAKSLAKNLNIELTEDILSDRAKLKEFIDNNVTNTKYSFSDKQLPILEKIDDNKIKDIINNNGNLSKDDYDYGSKAIQDYFNNSSSRTFKLSEKQLAVLRKNEDKLTNPIKQLLDKDELNGEEFKKVQAALQKIFKSFK